MAAFNKVILIGNLTADPELKQTQNGISVTSFSIAVSRRFSSKTAESAPQADFINVVAWRGTAEFITKFFQKGKSILIVGSLQSRSWTDQNGQKHYFTEVVADEVSFVGKRTDSAKGDGVYYGAEAPASAARSGQTPANFEDVVIDDDLPF